MTPFGHTRQTGLYIDFFFRHPLSGDPRIEGPDIPNGWRLTGQPGRPDRSAAAFGFRVPDRGERAAAKGSTFGISGEAPAGRGRHTSGVDRSDIMPCYLHVKEKRSIIGYIFAAVRTNRPGRRRTGPWRTGPRPSAAILTTRAVRSVDNAAGRHPGPRRVQPETGSPAQQARRTGRGRVAQRESTVFTRQGSLVRTQPRPPLYFRRSAYGILLAESLFSNRGL